MADAYKEWSKQGAVFHYVSASPWHLFVPLSRFMRRSSFPIGSLHLRKFRLKSSSRWNLLKSSKDYKLEIITRLLTRYPGRRFILVGDTGENDPEIYSEIARQFPTQIDSIYLRLVRKGDMPTERRRRTSQGLVASVTVFNKAEALAITP